MLAVDAFRRVLGDAQTFPSHIPCARRARKRTVGVAMSDVFISYARSTQAAARTVAEALRGLGYEVWLDDQLPAHRAYADVIEERLRAARAVVVIWSADAAKSEWVRSEAELARQGHKLVQLTVDRARLPMPFDQIQCADLSDWKVEADSVGWRQVTGSLFDLTAKSAGEASQPALAPAARPSGADGPLPPPTDPAANQDLMLTAASQADGEIRFRKQAVLFVVIVPALTVLNLVTSPHVLWFQWPLFGWGLALAVQGARVYLIPRGDRQALIARNMRRMRSSDRAPR